jgi:hypothetical protein
MDSFEEYFKRESIIKMLAKFRIATARKRHKIHLLRDVSYHKKTNRITDEKFLCHIDLRALLPPRRQWIRPHKSNREKMKSSQDVMVSSIIYKINQIETFYSSGLITKLPKWYRCLNIFISTVQNDALFNPNLKLNKPDIIPIKKKIEKDKIECRPIAVYGYRDRIIIGLCSKYFTDIFEELFNQLDCSFSFRSTKASTAKTHHDTIAHISAYKKQMHGKKLWVAECDIKKFFDCVNHDLLVTVFKKYVRLFYQKGILIDERANNIFYEYLRSFSFNENIYLLNGTDYFERFKIKGGFFKWEESALINKYYPQGIGDIKLGVPQGGALSCFISNLYLHDVDEHVLRKDAKSFYVRYCDDMIIIQDDKKLCHDALNRYSEAIEEKKLLIHKPTDVIYNNEYWGDKASKSKNPYLWASKNETGAIPWLGFVGYQVRFDGCIRIRMSSLEKEKEKQRTESEIVLNAIHYRDKDNLNFNSRKSYKALEFSLRQRLISMSIGRIKLFNYKSEEPTMCWTNGFRGISVNSLTGNQLRSLDKTRRNEMLRFKRILKKLNKVSDDSDDVKPLRFYGKPYSYYGFLQNNTINRRKINL